jgi:hypothetical protein
VDPSIATDTPSMSTAVKLDASLDASWRVTRDGALVALVTVSQEHGEVVITAGGASTEPKPYRFDSVQAADEFVGDLMTSFSYLGCEVAGA